MYPVQKKKKKSDGRHFSKRQHLYDIHKPYQIISLASNLNLQAYISPVCSKGYIVQNTEKKKSRAITCFLLCLAHSWMRSREQLYSELVHPHARYREQKRMALEAKSQSYLYLSPP